MITTINEYKLYLESNSVQAFIMTNKELIKEVQKDDTIYDRIRFFDVTDLREKDKQFFTVLKSNDKVIGITRAAHFSLSSRDENDLSISYFSIDKDYRYKGYSHLMMDKLFEYAGKNNYTISTSSYSYLGKIQLQKLIHKYAKKYSVELIDKDEMLDHEGMYKEVDGKYYHKEEI